MGVDDIAKAAAMLAREDRTTKRLVRATTIILVLVAFFERKYNEIKTILMDGCFRLLFRDVQC
jgi:hypothetical protein